MKRSSWQEHAHAHRVQQAEAERERTESENEAAANVRLAELATSGIADGLRRLADGDLSISLWDKHFAAI
ncbi:hypothetical protein ACQZ4O_26050 [Agrobacterium vitis]